MANCEFVTFLWYPGSGMVLDCIDYSFLPSFLLRTYTCKNILVNIEKILPFHWISNLLMHIFKF